MPETVTDEERWEKLSGLFERLLGGESLDRVLESESDPELRRRAEDLWKHHVSASEEEFLKDTPGFAVPPVFEPGQILVNRFDILRLLGSGGMGEVYLAYDRRMEEQVAIKTVVRFLAPSPAIRRRIVAEVQNARRVTHPNVCRIHELFEDGETVFFTMQYVRGRLLSDVLSEHPKPREAAALLRQIAEGLRAAHANGVIHGDFKPANIIVTDRPQRAIIMDFGLARAVEQTGSARERALSVRAGTAEFMAPELAGGAAPTVRSDIYGFGKVANLLLPGRKIWSECTRDNPEERPPSIDAVLDSLRPLIGRRTLLAGAGLACGAALTYPLWQKTAVPIYLPENARLLVNAFRSAASQLSAARLARALLVTALRESPRIHTIADEDFLHAMREAKAPYPAPATGLGLDQVLATLRAAFWVDAQIEQSGGRFSLFLNLHRTSNAQPVAVQSFRDLPAIATAAREAAMWLRESAGESQQSLAANPVDVAAFTSRVPEALQMYYDAMEHYAVAEMEQAVPLLREAIRLDPSFAQAHSMLGAVLRSFGNYEEAYAESERGLHLSVRLPDRERAILEAQFARMTDDPQVMIDTARRQLAYFPDEPRSYGNLAWCLSRNGSPEDAVPYNRKAIELSSASGLQRYDLIYNLCASDDFPGGLKEFETALGAESKSPWINENGALAYLGLERYDDALAAVEREPSGNHRLIDTQRVRILQGDLEGAIAGVRELHEPNELERNRAAEFLCGLYFVTGRPGLARQHLASMLDLPAYPLHARRFECAAFWALRLADDDVLNKAHETLRQIANRWPNGLTKGVELHAASLLAWKRNSLDEAGDLLLKASASASTIWMPYDLAELHAAKGKPEVAEDYWRQIEKHRAMILSYWFTGALVLGWLSRAAAAQARRDRTTAKTYSQKVLDHWARRNPGLPSVQSAQAILAFNSSGKG
jgi:serine/threonine protein kinase/Flp pilus assembly protein TadD